VKGEKQMSVPNPNTDQQIYYERSQEAKIVRRIVFIIVTIFLFTFLGILGGGYYYIKDVFEPVNENSTEYIPVKIPIGSSSSTIGKILEEEGLIKDARIFRFYVKFKNESGFQAGSYQLTQSMDIQQIIDTLKTGKIIKEVKFKLTIPEGLTVKQFAKVLASKELPYTEEEIYEKLHDREYIKSLIERYQVLDETILNKQIISPLEGYLFPITYDFFVEEPTLEEIIEKMILQTNNLLVAYQTKMDELGLTPHEVLTLASIVEREAGLPEDRPKVASVFHNRLKIGMALQSDVTVAYVLQDIGAIPTYEDTQVDSPYNTYKYPGIPVGPIANPRKASIEAVLNPTDENNLYFYARPNGEVFYSKTYDQHNQYKRQYQHEWYELNNDN
jgi:UPF0755 protein